jgi:hypothetical protein
MLTLSFFHRGGAKAQKNRAGNLIAGSIRRKALD